MKYACRSDAGQRPRNEDHYYAPQQDEAALVIVADGMGGHNAGMVASRLAVETVTACLNGNHSPGDDRIREAIARANEIIYWGAQREDACRGMGTTITLAVLEPHRYIAANIGDSRVYHYAAAQNSLRQITQDHSYVAALVASGEITWREAARHPQRNIITRALGTREKETPDLFHGAWEMGDVLLLCSDGLHGALAEDDILQILSQNGLALDEKCQWIVEAALRRDATDNVTAVLAQNDGEGGGL